MHDVSKNDARRLEGWMASNGLDGTPNYNGSSKSANVWIGSDSEKFKMALSNFETAQERAVGLMSFIHFVHIKKIGNNFTLSSETPEAINTMESVLAAYRQSNADHGMSIKRTGNHIEIHNPSSELRKTLLEVNNEQQRTKLASAVAPPKNRK